jgi:hypothetical protein
LVPAKDPRIHRSNRVTPRHPPQKTSETKNDLVPKNTAVHQVHFPDDLESLEQAKKTIAFEELFLLQISALLRKKEWEEKGREGVSSIALDPELIRTFFSAHCPLPLPIPKKSRFSKSSKTWRKHVPMLQAFRRRRGKRKNTGGACRRDPRNKPRTADGVFGTYRNTREPARQRDPKTLSSRMMPAITNRAFDGRSKGKKT